LGLASSALVTSNRPRNHALQLATTIVRSKVGSTWCLFLPSAYFNDKTVTSTTKNVYDLTNLELLKAEASAMSIVEERTPKRISFVIMILLGEP
jgi:hypothetical protein